MRGLLKPVTDPGIFKALFCLKPKKALGPNGLQPLYFPNRTKTLWDDQSNILSGVYSVEGDFPTGTNSKTQFIETINQYRPLSLCNTSYKLTKILVRRLRPYLDDFYFPYQSNFIPGCCAEDNITVL